jgi:hypothetical protein
LEFSENILENVIVSYYFSSRKKKKKGDKKIQLQKKVTEKFGRQINDGDGSIIDRTTVIRQPKIFGHHNLGFLLPQSEKLIFVAIPMKTETIFNCHP